MKHSFRRLVALTLFAFSLHAVTFAQDFGHTVRANIPFNFYAGDKMMPAGSYTISINRQSSVISLYERDNAIGAFLLGSPQEGSKYGRASLTFRANDENVYVLQKVQAPDIELTFGGGKRLSHLAENATSNATLTVLAEVAK